MLYKLIEMPFGIFPPASSNMSSSIYDAKFNKSETHYKGDRLELVNMFLNDLYKLFGAQMSYFQGPG